MLQKFVIVLTVMLGLTLAACAQDNAISVSQDSGEAVNFPVLTPAPDQIVLAGYGLSLPIIAGAIETEARDLGTGLTGFYQVPAETTRDTLQAYFDPLLAEIGFEGQGWVGPSLLYRADPLMVVVQLPEDGLMIVSIMQAVSDY